MKKKIVSLLLAVGLLLSGCASLLERSYGAVEPYADRFWETGVEDTLKAESYQDLVNTLLMLIEQRAQEGTIRIYTEPEQDAYLLAVAANEEIRKETMLGSYLLQKITFDHELSEKYSTLTYHITYRPDTQDPENLMGLSDSQSLVDLLRLAVREEHSKLTARFVYDMPRGEVSAAVESLWQELCRQEMDGMQESTQETEGEDSEETLKEAELSEPTGETETATPADPAPSEPNAASGQEEQPGDPQEPTEPEVEYPPCPWQLRFYPDKAAAEVVEILLS